MANRLQHLRGSEAEHSTFTGAKGEISLVTDTSADRIPTGEVRVHDGTTAGGLPLTLGTTSKPLTNNIVLSSGVGINFNNYGSEDSNSATTVGSNLLDDYEEGTWTPIDESGAGITFTQGRGIYTKIGDLVFFTALVIYPSTASSADASIGGLPFTVGDLQTANYFCASVAATDSNRRDNLLLARSSTKLLLVTLLNLPVANSNYSSKFINFSGYYSVR